MRLKIEPRASDRISELDRFYRSLNIEENIRELNTSDILNDIAVLLEIIYNMKIRSEREKVLDKPNIVG